MLPIARNVCAYYNLKVLFFKERLKSEIVCLKVDAFNRFSKKKTRKRNMYIKIQCMNQSVGYRLFHIIKTILDEYFKRWFTAYSILMSDVLT